MASRNSSSWPGLVLVIGTLLSMGLFAYARFLSTSRARIRFEEAATRAQRLLEDRLRDGEDLLRGVRGFANAHGPLDRASYRAYMEALDLKTRLPGLLGVTYGVPVARQGISPPSAPDPPRLGRWNRLHRRTGRTRSR